MTVVRNSLTGSPDDRALVRAFVERGEEQAFRTLYRRHATCVYRTVLRLCGGHERDAEDVLQVTWVRAAERMDSFRWESGLRSWITGIAINVAREHRRRSGREEPSAELPEDEGVLGPVRRLIAQISRIDLERAIARLPMGYREVLILHDIEGYTHAEIGSLLGIEAGTSKSQLSRARRAIRSWLQEPGE